MNQPRGQPGCKVAERGGEALPAGRSRIVASRDRGLHSGMLSEAEREVVLGIPMFTVDLDELADREPTPSLLPHCGDNTVDSTVPGVIPET